MPRLPAILLASLFFRAALGRPRYPGQPLPLRPSGCAAHRTLPAAPGLTLSFQCPAEVPYVRLEDRQVSYLAITGQDAELDDHQLEPENILLRVFIAARHQGDTADSQIQVRGSVTRESLDHEPAFQINGNPRHHFVCMSHLWHPAFFLRCARPTVPALQPLCVWHYSQAHKINQSGCRSRVDNATFPMLFMDQIPGVPYYFSKCPRPEGGWNAAENIMPFVFQGKPSQVVQCHSHHALARHAPSVLRLAAAGYCRTQCSVEDCMHAAPKELRAAGSVPADRAGQDFDVGIEGWNNSAPFVLQPQPRPAQNGWQDFWNVLQSLGNDMSSELRQQYAPMVAMHTGAQPQFHSRAQGTCCHQPGLLCHAAPGPCTAPDVLP